MGRERAGEGLEAMIISDKTSVCSEILARKRLQCMIPASELHLNQGDIILYGKLLIKFTCLIRKLPFLKGAF